MNDESKQMKKTSAKLIMEAIRNFGHSTSTYPSTDDIPDNKNHVPELLNFFVNEIVRSPVKKNSISQTILLVT